ncbi:MAG: hypothetical protein ACR2O6_14385, partial [Ilumatobacteraceae bacterium]
MAIPYDVVAVFVALAIWAGLLLHAFRASSFRNFLAFGVAMLAVLNIRYFVEGADDSIAFFVAIYD